MMMDVDGMSLAVQDRGAGPAIVLVHGNSLGADSYADLLVAEELEGFRLLVPDLPGHGASGPGRSRDVYSVPGYAKVVSQLLDHLELASVVMVGHSLGGHVVMEMLHSPRVAGALVFGAPPLANLADVPRAFLPHPAMAAAFQAELSDREAADLGAALAGPEGARASRWIGSTATQVRQGLGESLQAGRFADEVALVRSFDRPLAILLGEHDPLVNRRYVEDLALPNLWRGAVQVVPGVGHSPQLEHPRAFLEIAVPFVHDALTHAR